MNGTPRLSSRFPQTPPSRRQNDSPRSNESKPRQSLPDISALKAEAANDGPLLPLDTIDAPQQRLLAVSFYVALLAWRLYDFHYLNEEDTESLWMFMKWVAIDGVFLFGLPELRIPWLEWAQGTMVVIFLLHALMDGVLMFRIPIPLGSALVALGKLFYDRELAISERSVKYSSLLQDNSHLLGRQIIKILPEGSAVLNPEQEHFCLSQARTQVFLPIRINQTTPISMSLIHYDLLTNANETTILTAAQIKKMMRESHKSTQHSEVDGLVTIKVPVKKPGLYKLGKVVDQSGLEVRRRSVGDSFVVDCPRAVIQPLEENRCRGDLSNVRIEVTGTPPLKLRYRKLINHVEQEANLQSIQPDDLVSPLAQSDSMTMVKSGVLDVTWARTRTVQVPLSESLSSSGKWAFSLEQVQDAFGNTISYTLKDHETQEKQHPKSASLHQVITVHERPTVVLSECSPQRPLKVARGRDARLPLRLGSTGKGSLLDSKYQIEYHFTPEAELTTSGDHSDRPQISRISLGPNDPAPRIRDAGLYTVRGVASSYCLGEVNEPASCLLQNPPEPSIEWKTQEIFDKCAKKPVGLRVDFELTGTPPFSIQYVMERRSDGRRTVGFVELDSLRGQEEFTPRHEGHFKYQFTEISDATYKAHSIRDKNLVLEQDVKPSASASFASSAPKSICIDQSVRHTVNLRGEGPFTLEYELIRGNQRTPFKIQDMKGSTYEIVTPNLGKGGDYILSLASVTDRMGCKEFLQEEAKITVRHQKPKAGFGLVEGSRLVKTLERKKVLLPLRLTGDGPWTVEYRNTKHPDHIERLQLAMPNDKLETLEDGKFELVSVHDRICPGVIDTAAQEMEIRWLSRPSLSLQEASFDKVHGHMYVKRDVCEGDDDSVDLHLQGSPPFEVKYSEHIKADKAPKGQKALAARKLTAALTVSSIRMNTAQAGLVEYQFTELADYNYDHSKYAFTPLTIQQRVHAKPSASFKNPGKTYNYCTSFSSSVETVPISLVGTPPFSIDYELRHTGKAQGRIHTVTDIRTNAYALSVASSDLQPGTSTLSLRKVTDSRGCSTTIPSGQPRVQISVHAAPSIVPLDALRTDFCVRDRLSYSLSGAAPFTVYYTFNGQARKATSTSTTFRRLAEKAGTFTITAIQDSASSCKAEVKLTSIIHGLPSAKVANGKAEESDIHEGGSADIEFTFGGEGPWEFVWARSTLERGGKPGKVLEMRSETSDEATWKLKAGEEGIYEVVKVRDKWCEVKREGVEVNTKAEGRKLLMNSS